MAAAAAGCRLPLVAFFFFFFQFRSSSSFFCFVFLLGFCAFFLLNSTRPRPAHTDCIFAREGEASNKERNGSNKTKVAPSCWGSSCAGCFCILCPWGHYTPPSLPVSYLSVALALPCDWARGIRFQIYLRVLNGWMVLAELPGTVVRWGGVGWVGTAGGWASGWVGGWVGFYV